MNNYSPITKRTLAPWLYREKPYEVVTDGVVGFCYLITHKATGRSYVGKKSFWSRTSKRVSGKSRRKWTTRESDWRNYFGSSDELKEAVKRYGPGAFTREILHLCSSKKEMAYLETKEQFKRDVLHSVLSDGSRAYFNNNIMGRFFAANERASLPQE